MLWLTPRAALPALKTASLPSNAVGDRLRALAAEIEALGAEPVHRALDIEIGRRAEAYLAGLEAYRRHPFRRNSASHRVVWRRGTTRLLDYGPNGPNGPGPTGPAVLVIPSLINRYYVLDLLPERSFLRHLAGFGLRTFVIDWGVPGSAERDFDLTDYIGERLEAALTAAAAVAGRPVGLVGYCMGGLLALALAVRCQSVVGCLALLATPWDFHAQNGRGRLLALVADCLAGLPGGVGGVPVEVIQTLFFFLDPFSAE